VLVCALSFPSADTLQQHIIGRRFMSLSRLFDWLNKKKEEKSIKSFIITQRVLEQIFLEVVGDQPDMNTGVDGNENLIKLRF